MPLWKMLYLKGTLKCVLVVLCVYQTFFLIRWVFFLRTTQKFDGNNFSRSGSIHFKHYPQINIIYKKIWNAFNNTCPKCMSSIALENIIDSKMYSLDIILRSEVRKISVVAPWLEPFTFPIFYISDH